MTVRKVKRQVRDKKSGRLRPKHKISAKARAADRKRRGHKMKAATKMKIRKTRRREAQTHRTKSGRRFVKAKRHP